MENNEEENEMDTERINQVSHDKDEEDVLNEDEEEEEDEAETPQLSPEKPKGMFMFAKVKAGQEVDVKEKQEKEDLEKLRAAKNAKN